MLLLTLNLKTHFLILLLLSRKGLCPPPPSPPNHLTCFAFVQLLLLESLIWVSTSFAVFEHWCWLCDYCVLSWILIDSTAHDFMDFVSFLLEPVFCEANPFLLSYYFNFEVKFFNLIENRLSKRWYFLIKCNKLEDLLGIWSTDWVEDIILPPFVM
jgi:hypothetical protein